MQALVNVVQLLGHDFGAVLIVRLSELSETSPKNHLSISAQLSTQLTSDSERESECPIILLSEPQNTSQDPFRFKGIC